MSGKRYLGGIITPTPTEPTANFANGVWSLAEANAYKKANVWPTTPEAPTIGTATDAQSGGTVFVAFTPQNLYGASVVQYTATSTPGSITGTGASSPVTVSGLSDGTSYTFTVNVQTNAGTSPESSSSNSVTPSQLDTGIFAGGMTTGSVYLNVIQQISISTTGNSTDFGDLASLTGEKPAGGASSTRGLVGGGVTAGASNTISYVTIASAGNATDFGDLTQARFNIAAASNQTTCSFYGGNPLTNRIDRVTIASTGNAIDTGDLNFGSLQRLQGCSSPTRGVVAGAEDSSGFTRNYIMFNSFFGSTSDFGDLSTNRQSCGAASSNTRGVFAGGQDGGTYYNTIDYITIASTGNATDFGDLEAARSGRTGVSNRTRAVFCGGRLGGTYYSNLRYITIATTGNTSSFGSLLSPNDAPATFSDCHGGLS